jgi:hypothetical protein
LTEGGVPLDVRVTLRCLRRDLGIAWPLGSPLESLRGSHDLLDGFLDSAPRLVGPGEWLACARPALYRKFRVDQWRGVSSDEAPALWLLCGGLRRQGDSSDAYMFCCAETTATGIAPTDTDRERQGVEEPFRANRNLLESARLAMTTGLAEARAHEGGEVPVAFSDGVAEYRASLWCFRVDSLEELTCVVSVVAATGERLSPGQLEAVMALFLEGRPASELEFPWSAPRVVDPAAEYSFRRLADVSN